MVGLDGNEIGFESTVFGQRYENKEVEGDGEEDDDRDE